MLTRKELQNALKTAKAAGLTTIKLNAKTEVLQAEFERLANGTKTEEMVNVECETSEPKVKALDVAKAIAMLETLPEKVVNEDTVIPLCPIVEHFENIDVSFEESHFYEDGNDHADVEMLDFHMLDENDECYLEGANTTQPSVLQTSKKETLRPANLGGALVELVKLERKAAKLVHQEVATMAHKYTKNVIETQWGQWLKGQFEYNMGAFAF